MKKISYNKPTIIAGELEYIRDAVESGKISGDGKYSRKCQELMEDKFGIARVLLTTSCTSALEMSSLLINLKPGDEVIMPSYTFVSTANAFILRGAIPVFIDIREDTLNIDERLIVKSITDKTRAIIPVHYAGVGCEMDTIMEIAREKQLCVVEDAAQGINASYKGKYLGTIGDLGAFSFHETKNITCGEGGALLINNKALTARAEIILEKGTNRKKFFRGEIDKYTWIDVGSSYLMSDILAAYLFAQLENLEKIQKKRQTIFEFYYESLRDMQKLGKLKLPVFPANCRPNYHIFYILFPDEKQRNKVLKKLKEAGILAVFHYVPLHLSPMGRIFGYKPGDFPVTEDLSNRIIRLPLYYELTIDEAEFVVSELKKII